MNPWRRRTKFGEPDSLIDWVICGGESGPNARPMHPDWARSLRGQCAAAGVPFLFKQWGHWVHENQTLKDNEPVGKAADFWIDGTPGDKEGTALALCDSVRGDVFLALGKKNAGRLLDGVEHNGFPS